MMPSQVLIILPGGGPQGTLLGLIEYFVQSNDNADCVEPGLPPGSTATKIPEKHVRKLMLG